ncbi:F-box protein At5g49610-like isoform X1 [Chenopodium quinoa]|uniref:F-box domain-containing protein n=1 Tax=Chenopodium quinoa TaxID=63459 RepID=A0A803MNB8_CHEQI|nr:F-box protein At5g49610-like isoform X1 [Chenopodium quinoa]
MNSIGSRNGFFPDEVILQILSRLPIKSVFRFRAVCKYWYQLLSERYFVHLYNEMSVRSSMILVEITEISESKSSLICVDYSKGVSEFPLNFLKDRVKVRASCNGLLCCSSIPDKGVFYLCNPVTREYKLLPKCRERPVTSFYPDGEATLVGIACDLYDTRKFSVVLAGYHRPFGYSPTKTFICMVYNSEINQWRKFVTLQEEHFTQMNRNQVVFVNGMLHWLTVSYSCIIVLDLETDVWRKIYLPDEMSYGKGNRMYLLESYGCLSVVQISDASMDVWVMEDYEKQLWRRVDRVSLRCIRGLAPGVFPISQTGDCVFLATHKQVLVYNRSTAVWKEMYSVKSNSTLPLWFSAYAFRSTIYSFH